MNQKSCGEDDWGQYTGTPDQSPKLKPGISNPNHNQLFDGTKSGENTPNSNTKRQDDLINFMLSDKFVSETHANTDLLWGTSNQPPKIEPQYFTPPGIFPLTSNLKAPMPNLSNLKRPNYLSDNITANPVKPAQNTFGTVPFQVTDSKNQKRAETQNLLTGNTSDRKFIPSQPSFSSNLQRPTKRQSLPTLPSNFNSTMKNFPQVLASSSFENSPETISRAHGSFPNLAALAQAINSSPQQQARKFNFHSPASGFPLQVPKVSSESDLSAPKTTNIQARSNLQSDKVNEDKKAKRLAKNRESARASRRKNKEYVEKLEASNLEMYKEITKEKWAFLQMCNSELRQLRKQEIKFMQSRWAGNSFENPTSYEGQVYNECMNSIHKKYGPCCDEKRAMLEYQHEELVSKIFPPYQRFLLWLTGQSDQFFERIDGSTSDVYKWTTSNKFIGDKLFSQGKTTANTDHGGGMWQLLCHEIGISLEQEEKLTNIRRRVRDDESSYRERNCITEHQHVCTFLGKETMDTAINTHHTLEKFYNLLTPAQMWDYFHWMETHEHFMHQLQQTDFLQCVDELLKEDSEDFVQILQKPEEELSMNDVKNILGSIP